MSFLRRLRYSLPIFARELRWLFNRPARDNPFLPGSYYVNAVRSFPGGLTVIDKSMIKQVGPTIGDSTNQ